MVSIGKRWDTRKNRDVKSFYRNEGHRVLCRSRTRARCAHRLSSLRFATRNFAPSWTLIGAPARRKELPQKELPVGEISVLSHWVTSGEAIFRESESNVTWRCKSEGTDVETVTSNRYFDKLVPHTFRKAQLFSASRPAVRSVFHAIAF